MYYGSALLLLTLSAHVQRVVVVSVSRSVCVCVCVCVCPSVKSFGASVRPENTVTYSAGNEGRNIRGVFAENASFQSYRLPALYSSCRVGHFLTRNMRVDF